MKSVLKKIFLLTFLFLFATVSSLGAASIEPENLRCENLKNPVGIGVQNPRLSWVNEATDDDARALAQSAYRVLAASSEKLLAENSGDLWDSGWVTSTDAINVVYAGKPIQTSQRVYWKVAVKDQAGTPSEWSEPARWVAAVMDSADWKAKWIGQSDEVRGVADLDGASWIGSDNAKAKEIFLRKEFTLDVTAEALADKTLTAAFRYAGNKKFEMFVNGKKIGHSIGGVYNADILRSIDITEYLVSGRNAVAVKVGEAVEGPTAFFGKIEIQKLVPADNSGSGRGWPSETILAFGSDESWQVAESAADGWNGVDFATEWKTAKSLFAADDGPWGKLRRLSEKTSPYFTKSFTPAAGKKITEATLHITGLGFYEAYLNGKKVGNKLLDPAPTKFDKTVLYSTYDVTDAVSAKRNELEVAVGHGWYDVRSVVTWNFDAAPWRDFPRMIAQLEIRYDDDSSETICSDESWETTTSPIVFDCIRQGEIVDGLWEKKTLGPAAVVEAPRGKLTAEAMAPTVILKEFPATGVEEISEKVWLVDLGANIAGWCRVKFDGLKKGQVVRLRYAERPAVDGAINRFEIEQHFMEGSPAYYAGGKGGFQTDYYIASGRSGEVFEPRFTYNGFQYIEVTGVDEAPKPENFTACVVGNAFETTGEFECSNDLLNAIQAATKSSYHSNFVDGYPTDCPHREKNGWTGDAHLACELAMYNFENTAGYEKWLRDLRDEQRENGNLAAIVPTGGWGYPWGNGPAWDSSLVLIPWYNYIYKGDRRILEESFDAIKKYVDYTTTRADGRFLVTHGLGDWVPVKTVTPVEVTSTGYWYVDTKILARAAEILGKKEDAQKYGALAEKIAAAYNQELYKGEGVYSIGSQTALSCSLYQGFVPPTEDAAVYERLFEQVPAANHHLDVGILGAKYLLRTLSAGGRTDLALTMMLKEKQPCYADWLRRGGGTLWEDWGEGSSRNHIMFGDVSAWYYQFLAGIRLADTGKIETAAVAPNDGNLAFKKLIIAPCCSKAEISPIGFEPISWAKAEVETVRGSIKTKWEWNDEFTRLKLDVEIPVGSAAQVVVPVEEGQTSFCETDKTLEPDYKLMGGHAVYNNVGSGKYSFIVE